MANNIETSKIIHVQSFLVVNLIMPFQSAKQKRLQTF